jgi:hypothetical protein
LIVVDPPAVIVSLPPATTSFWTLSASAAVAQIMTADVASAVVFQSVRNMSLPPLLKDMAIVGSMALAAHRQKGGIHPSLRTSH